MSHVIALVALAAGFAQDKATLKYQFKEGQVLRYEGKQSLAGETTVSGSTQKFSSQTNSTREWRVTKVDDKGNARMQMTIVRVEVDATDPAGQRTQFDTEKTEKHPLAGMIGKPLLELTLSPQGEVSDIKELNAAARTGPYVAHVRTTLVPLPVPAIAPKATWQRDLKLPLPPPDSGGQVTLRQTFRLEKLADSVASINLQSTLAEETKDKGVLARAVQFLPAGKIEFDVARGVMRSMDLTIDQTVKEFAGADSVMKLTGTYREVLKD